jgi:heat shock protein HslJ
MKKYLRRTIAVVLFIALTLLATACQPAATATPTPSTSTSEFVLQGIEWQATDLTDNISGNKVVIPKSQDYTIIFRVNGTLEGKADCNSFSGRYTQDNGGITITVDTTTQAYCGDTSLDQQYLTFLGTVVAGGPDGQGNLALENAGGTKRMLFQNGGAATQ